MDHLDEHKECRQKLLGMIDDFLAGRATHDEFVANFYLFYLEEVPWEALTDYDHDFFALVQEKIEWTGDDPPEVDRKDGWMDREEYRDWLRQSLKEYLIALP